MIRCGGTLHPPPLWRPAVTAGASVLQHSDDSRSADQSGCIVDAHTSQVGYRRTVFLQIFFL